MSDLVDRLKNAAESWKRTDCMIAREVLSEAALLDEAASRIEWLEALFDFSDPELTMHHAPNDPVTKDACVVRATDWDKRPIA